MSDTGEILALLGRMGAQVEEIERTVHKLARHQNIPQGDNPRTFHVKATKVDTSTAEPIGGKWKLDSKVTPEMKQGAKPEGKSDGRPKA
jgi:hypothetical protein